MEKISLYDLLSVLLPGAILTLTINLLLADFGIKITDININNYFSLTLFLSSAIFLGSIVNITTRGALKVYRQIGLFDTIHKIYDANKELDRIKPFFNELHNTLEGINNDDCDEHTKIEHIWSEIYYELEAKDQIKSPKNFQSFYFFFRNIFTTSIILLFLLPIGFLGLQDIKYLVFMIFALITTLLSVYAGKWYRKQMVNRMFWTYYSLNKNKSTQPINI